MADGERLYFQGNTDRTLRIADVHDPAHPVLLSETPLPDEPKVGDNRRLGSTYPQVRGRYLYTPGYARIWDVGDPRKPQLVGECRDAGYENDTCALADLAGRPYLVIGSIEGLKVVDVHDPRHPRLAGVAPGDHQGGHYFARGIQVVGTTVVRNRPSPVGHRGPVEPGAAGAVGQRGGERFHVRRQGGGWIAFVLGYYGGCTWWTVRNPREPKLIDHFQQGSTGDAAAWDNLSCYQGIDLRGGFVYRDEYYSGLQVVEYALALQP